MKRYVYNACTLLACSLQLFMLTWLHNMHANLGFVYLPTTAFYAYNYKCISYMVFLYATQFKMAQDYFKSAEGGVLLDVSCGSGLFSRKFAKSGTYSGVVALDFSENMLRQCYDFLKKDPTLLAT